MGDSFHFKNYLMVSKLLTVPIDGNMMLSTFMLVFLSVEKLKIFQILVVFLIKV